LTDHLANIVHSLPENGLIRNYFVYICRFFESPGRIYCSSLGEKWRSKSLLETPFGQQPDCRSEDSAINTRRYRSPPSNNRRLRPPRRPTFRHGARLRTQLKQEIELAGQLHKGLRLLRLSFVQAKPGGSSHTYGRSCIHTRADPSRKAVVVKHGAHRTQLQTRWPVCRHRFRTRPVPSGLLVRRRSGGSLKH
jgi:hypothetical protein